MSLLDLSAFESTASVLREAALKLRTVESSVTISAPLDENGIISAAILEGALLDAGIPYQRRLRDNPTASKGPSICLNSNVSSQLQPVESNPLCIHICPVEVDALLASDGSSRKGVLSTVAICAALAQSISPSGAMSRMLMPWALSGNWLSDAMEHTYDPVFTVMRDYLSKEGFIRVVPMPEVPEVNPDSIPGVDIVALGAVRDRWGQLDLEGRAQSLSHLLKNLLTPELPSTARLEELGWHRVMAAGWEQDLASQLTSFVQSWRDDPSTRRKQSGEIIDGLLRTGKMV